ncbi:MAG: hypothetical protein AAGG48_10835, partial [Planctomycetota bacterium]
GHGVLPEEDWKIVSVQYLMFVAIQWLGPVAVLAQLKLGTGSISSRAGGEDELGTGSISSRAGGEQGARANGPNVFIRAVLTGREFIVRPL